MTTTCIQSFVVTGCRIEWPMAGPSSQFGLLCCEEPGTMPCLDRFPFEEL